MRRLLCVFSLVLVCGVAVGEEGLFEGAPAAPPGYEDYQKARMAVMSGKVPAVENPSSVPDGIAFHDDVEYASHDGVSLSLDMYVPEAAEAPPVLLFIHGGGWRGGKKEDAALYAIWFAERGYAAASVQYRLSPNHTFPAAIHDVRRAMVWLKAHGEEYGFDGSRMVLLGGSAGGHLALLAGYSQDPALACPEGGAAPAVKGVVNLYGVVDCTTPRAQAAYQVRDFIGATYDEKAASYALASPIRHLDTGDPPTLTFHGTIDELVPISQADTLHAKLDELGIENYYDRVEGWPHSMDLARPISERCRFVIGRFLAEYLPVKQ